MEFNWAITGKKYLIMSSFVLMKIEPNAKCLSSLFGEDKENGTITPNRVKHGLSYVTFDQ